MRSLLLILFISLSLPSCSNHSYVVRAIDDTNASLEASGSPRRWVLKSYSNDGSAVFSNELIGQPCTSAADVLLLDDTLKNIGNIEAGFGGSAAPTLLETRCVAVDEDGSVSEVWVVAREDKQIPYMVKFQTDAAGGVNMDIRGPW